jgi:primosomal protein N' (replication factor Y)
VEHRFIGLLRCHHCGHATPTPATCPSCAGQGSLVGCGPGVERVAEEVAALLPGARVAIATSDTVSGPGAAAALIGRIVEREIDVVIATQMLAKGHHFPHLTLVGVVDADLGLSGGDLRAAERTFQMLAQVAGRSGRAERPGRVLVQTHMPEHPVIAALIAGDRDAFIAAECEARREAGMPPFSRLAALVVSAVDETAVERAARDLAVAAGTAGIEVFGPAVPPLALLRGRHRRRLLLRAARSEPLSALIRPWIIAARWPRAVRVQVDIDPYTFL